MEPIALPVQIAVMGDFGDGGTAQYEVAESMRRVAADRDVTLLLTTGDNFYSDALSQIWHQPYGWLEDQGIRVAAAWGNHDLESDRRRELVEEILKPPGRWYSAELGTGKLIVLDSNRVDDESQTEWLKSELGRATEPIVVAFHHPALSCGLHGSTPSVRTNWVPLFDEHEVSLVVNGHDHHYERFVAGPTTYVVTGGGGRHLRPKASCPRDTPEPEVGDYDTYHFVLLEITDSKISAEVLGADSETIDRFSIDY